ncbi:hypothetical protein [Fusibacter ferrireducens]|uniref:Uncharacterized protein n=1 Tax=Fusibacter ferrireducens TaxID=2785058 RepID=A0ABR9ZNC7_9FIRM|nr:hypothetical protein [Fusibacter ferrireducens]MBF4691486.1 hypothetical protein [Fusibacter ferrireducens]
MRNLWNISNLEAETKNSPNRILEEQAKHFEKSTKDVLYCNISNFTIKNAVFDSYKLATKFAIVAPNLDKYTYVVCTIFSNPETDYPVSIKENGDIGNVIDQGTECQDYDELVEELERILSSEKVTNVIRNLYSKSKTI